MPGRAGGSVQLAPASSFSVQIARSASAREAHELGGGDGGVASPSLPATTRTSTPGASIRGMFGSHSIVKCGSTSLSRAGRFSQIWNSSTGFGSAAVDEREHLAVRDSLAGGQPLDVAAAEPRGRAERIGVIDQASAHDRDGLEAAVRMRRKARHDLAVIHAPAVLAGEVLPRSRPASDAAGPSWSLPAG